MSLDRILLHLQDVGPSTQAEIAEALGLPANRVAADCWRLVRESAGGDRPQRAHVSAWVNEHIGARRYPRAVYAIGPGSNAMKPRMTRAAKLRRQAGYYHARRERTVTSVWDLGLRVRDRMEGERWGRV